MRKTMLLLAVFGLVSSLWAADPFIGTWKLNISKSKVDPAPKSQIAEIEAQGSSFSWIFDTVEADGKATKGEWSGKYDGNDYKLTGNPSFDTVATKKINANLLDSVLKKGGKVVGSGQETVSKDGKTLTLSAKLKNAQGQDIETISVYEKQ